jgi:hypothetical protein
MQRQTSESMESPLRRQIARDHSTGASLGVPGLTRRRPHIGVRDSRCLDHGVASLAWTTACRKRSTASGTARAEAWNDRG